MVVGDYAEEGYADGGFDEGDCYAEGDFPGVGCLLGGLVPDTLNEI